MANLVSLKKLFPGLAVAGTVGLAASFLSEHYGAPAMLFALLLGMALSFLSEQERTMPGLMTAGSTILRVGVALLGFRIAWQDVMAVGWKPVLMIAVAIGLTIGFGVLVARLFGQRRRFGLLTGGAVAICGASAALALSSVLPKGENSERDTAFTVIGITSLSTAAMILYPLIASSLGLDAHQAGIFLGATIHDVAQVVGAGYSLSTEAGDIATLTKLMRVAFLVPVVMLTVMSFRRSGIAAGDGASPTLLPPFLVAFVAIVAINSLISIPAVVTETMGTLSRLCLLVAIAAIGLKTDMRKLTDVGLKPVLLMLAETVWLALIVLVALPFVDM
ncbi:YeiH family protein [Pseudokordiimonas caeni]|uniref:YeiH family protein n=1 Tax=Pseudokordiimonas caeni TaxID=2997908 RepID=UPI0028120A25|nr:putative sulfate exporter family transporter [Pseudokordiimonas caeni]